MIHGEFFCFEATVVYVSMKTAAKKIINVSRVNHHKASLLSNTVV
jgi:hypothetical protein